MSNSCRRFIFKNAKQGVELVIASAEDLGDRGGVGDHAYLGVGLEIREHLWANSYDPLQRPLTKASRHEML